MVDAYKAFNKDEFSVVINDPFFLGGGGRLTLKAIIFKKSGFCDEACHTSSSTCTTHSF